MPETQNTSYDFAIIGCGIAGASLAYELSSNGAKVLVVEAEAFPAFHTTGRSAAFFMEGYGNEVVRRITQASRDFYANPPKDFNESPLLNPLGALYIATEEQSAKLKQTVHTLKKIIPDCELVDQNFIRDKVKAIKPAMTQGYWEPQAKEINVAELMQGYIKLAKRQGSDFVFSEAVKTLTYQNLTWRINENFSTNILINAAGAWADSIAQLTNTKPLSLIPKKRNICIAKPLVNNFDIQTWPLCIDIDEQFYFKPEGEYLLITPADELPDIAHDAQADELQIALGIERVKQVLDIEFSSLQKQWAGLRTFAKDKSPVVGFDGNIENFFWMAGQGGYGIQMAPAPCQNRL